MPMRRITVQRIAEKPIEFGLQTAFAVIEQKANEGGKRQFPFAREGLFIETVTFDETRI
jgi:hypothetical protein